MQNYTYRQNVKVMNNSNCSKVTYPGWFYTFIAAGYLVCELMLSCISWLLTSNRIQYKMKLLLYLAQRDHISKLLPVNRNNHQHFVMHEVIMFCWNPYQAIIIIIVSTSSSSFTWRDSWEQTSVPCGRYMYVSNVSCNHYLSCME